eukprot:CAMPEP_0177637416 /NCGR_PEP_ID=MMETSP0447-20121125/4960_1 /TAXON_ID=0 /ORGANISM="Stygamoeba regulata, Strain BSH-02190019" /LENGTH=139 /DNA_ID=CAMNT_0019139343 /DNA_START=349 /DNA_END=768 /DNA_ORIENTATION=-
MGNSNSGTGASEASVVQRNALQQQINEVTKAVFDATGEEAHESGSFRGSTADMYLMPLMWELEKSCPDIVSMNTEVLKRVRSYLANGENQEAQKLLSVLPKLLWLTPEQGKWHLSVCTDRPKIEEQEFVSTFNMRPTDA